MAATTDLAVRLSGVGKSFRLYQEQTGSLRNRLTGLGRTRFREFAALTDIDLEVPKGTMLGIIGSNGSGKSTLLRVIARVYRPTSGRVETQGRVSALLELGAGFHHELSGRENIRLNAAIMGIADGRVQALLDDIVAMADIGEFIDSPVEVYSSGMRARLGFAIAVHLDPEVLLVDETIAVGDLQFYEKSMEQFDRMVAGGTTVLLVSHSLGLIERKADMALWLEHGRVAAFGDPASVVGRYIDHYTGGEPLDPYDATLENSDALFVESRAGDGCAYSGGECTVRVRVDSWSETTGLQVNFVSHHGPLPYESSVEVPLGAVGVESGELAVVLPVVPLPPGQYAVEVVLIGSTEGRSLRTPILVYPDLSDAAPAGHLVMPLEIAQGDVQRG